MLKSRLKRIPERRPGFSRTSPYGPICNTKGSLVHQMFVLNTKKLVIVYSFSFWEMSSQHPKTYQSDIQTTARLLYERTQHINLIIIHPYYGFSGLFLHFLFPVVNQTLYCQSRRKTWHVLFWSDDGPGYLAQNKTIRVHLEVAVRWLGIGLILWLET